MSQQTELKNVTNTALSRMKKQGEKIVSLTAYDASFAGILDDAGVEMILVGDSLGMVVQGENSTVPVTIDEMIYHTRCVAKGIKRALLIADMPFMSCATEEQSYKNAAQLMRAGGHLVKVEGGSWFTNTVSKLTERGIPVCVHLGLTPQSVNKFGGYKVQGRDEESRAALINDSIAAEKAGAAILLFECIPSDLMEEIMTKVTIPVIGIGAGPSSDGQVLVLHDMIGATTGKVAKFVHNFMPDGDGSIQGAIAAYHQAVTNGTFPKPEHGFD